MVENRFDSLGRAKGTRYTLADGTAQNYAIEYADGTNLVEDVTVCGDKHVEYTYDGFDRKTSSSVVQSGGDPVLSEL